MYKKPFTQRITSLNKNEMLIRNVSFVTPGSVSSFACPFPHLIWRIFRLSFNVPPPGNVTNMSGNWLNGVDKITKDRICLGTYASVWALWNYRNDLVF